MTVPQLDGLQIEVLAEGQGTRETRRGKQNSSFSAIPLFSKKRKHQLARMGRVTRHAPPFCYIIQLTRNSKLKATAETMEETN